MTEPVSGDVPPPLSVSGSGGIHPSVMLFFFFFLPQNCFWGDWVVRSEICSCLHEELAGISPGEGNGWPVLSCPILSCIAGGQQFPKVLGQSLVRWAEVPLPTTSRQISSWLMLSLASSACPSCLCSSERFSNSLDGAHCLLSVPLVLMAGFSFPHRQVSGPRNTDWWR